MFINYDSFTIHFYLITDYLRYITGGTGGFPLIALNGWSYNDRLLNLDV